MDAKLISERHLIERYLAGQLSDEEADAFERALEANPALARDVERIARSRPWLVAGGGTVLGFLAARFTKASSSRRFEQNGGTQSRQALPRTTGAGVRGGGDVGDV